MVVGTDLKPVEDVSLQKIRNENGSKKIDVLNSVINEDHCRMLKRTQKM